ncbi:hypothetical protein PCL_12565 [Purpureocillium lilacinum]|uniref:Uncharacterized protein n=1 Tax=Purpureocillium lilacinum TaxID=33203 RepID=A0A2U3E9L9_PURLI|nr:hypothetical protein PCL_12565 [Purpureocillium lilacinum]
MEYSTVLDLQWLYGRELSTRRHWLALTAQPCLLLLNASLDRRFMSGTVPPPRPPSIPSAVLSNVDAAVSGFLHSSASRLATVRSQKGRDKRRATAQALADAIPLRPRSRPQTHKGRR